MMLFNLKANLLRPALFILLIGCWPAARAAAQATAEDALPRPAGVVNLDLWAPLVQLTTPDIARSGVQYNQFGFPLPLRVSYERPLGQRFSLEAELLFNVASAFDSRQRESGLNLPLRYYFGRRQRAARLLGGYLAPLVTGRFKQERSADDYYYKEVNRRMIGGGLLVGYQGSLWRKLRLDASMGVGAAIPQLSSYHVSFTSLSSFYPGLEPVANDYGYGGFFDMHIGIGYEF